MAALMEQALAADPNNAMARTHLAAARLALGAPGSGQPAR